jgi:hypothetical protein
LLALLKRPAARAGLAVILLTLLAGVFFSDGLFRNRSTLIWDSADQYFPFLNLASRLWRGGQVPLWNPFLYNGYPLIGEPQYQTFYPINLLISQVSAFTPRTLLFQVAFHQLLGGVFTYLLAGLWIESTPARLLSAVVYMLNGCFWARQEHVVTIDTEVWLPLVLFAVERAGRAWSAPRFAFAAGAIALLLLAGHPQSFYFSLLIVGLSTLFWMAEARAAPALPAWRPLAVFGAALGVGLLLAAVQLLPTWELTGLSNRSDAIPYEVAIGSGALRPSHLVTLFFPNFYGALTGPYLGEGDIAQSSIYFGFVPLLLVGFAFAGRLGRRGLYLVAMAAFALLVSLGPSGLLSWALYRVDPLFALFRSPANYSFAFMLFAALLAGHGLSSLQRNEARLGRYGLYLVAVVLSAVLLVQRYPHTGLDDPEFERSALVLAALFFLLLLLVALQRARFVRPSITAWLVLALASMELLVVGHGAMSLGVAGPASTYCEETPSSVVAAVEGLPGQGCARPDRPVLDQNYAAFAQRIHADAKVYPEGTPVADVKSLVPVGENRALLHQLFLTDGYDPLVLKRHVEFHRFIEGLGGAAPNEPPVHRVAALARVLVAAGVKYLLMGGSVVEIPRPLPRVYFVARSRTVPDGQAALRALADPSVDLRSEVILEGDDPRPPGNRSAPLMLGWKPVDFLSETASRLAVQVHAPQAGYVVFSDTFYPGWEASVNGRPAPVLRANHSFKAVRVEAGPSDVVFQFRPRSLHWGAIVSLLTLLSGTVLLLICAIYRRRAAFS